MVDGQLLAGHSLALADLAHGEDGSCEAEKDEDKDEQGNEEVNDGGGHAVVAAVAGQQGVASGDKVVEGSHGGKMSGSCSGSNWRGTWLMISKDENEGTAGNCHTSPLAIIYLNHGVSSLALIHRTHAPLIEAGTAYLAGRMQHLRARGMDKSTGTGTQSRRKEWTVTG